MKKSRPPGIRPYDHPAGGWDALKAVAKTLARQQIVAQGSRTLLKANQPEGFDCPGCAWPDPKHTSSFEFCENGAKAITWESTAKRTDASFFSNHTVSELWDWTDHELEDAGRLTLPLRYNPVVDRYEPIDWGEAFGLIASGLNKLGSPDQAEFYTSGRSSNEAAFLYQLFVRAYGTNNFPDCSNMCHEATSVGLPKSIGVGKGTVTLEDFDHADAIFSFGHNPGTNHPRMMTTLHQAARRGVPIIVFNPLKERALERFAAPQDPVEMVTMSSIDGRAKALICLGGNLAVAMSDPQATFAGMRNLDLSVHIATKLNRSHLLTARTTLVLPCLGRTDLDLQASGPQSVTVEDSMSMVHASRGFLNPPGESIRSEPAIIAGIAKATLGDRHGINWDEMIANYDLIRDKIEEVFPQFSEFNTRVRKPGGFRLDVAASFRRWNTPDGKANFLTSPQLFEDSPSADEDVLMLTTIRSHGQYNTTIYGLDDRYRGVFGRRDVVFMNTEDLADRGLKDGDRIDVLGLIGGPGDKHLVSGFTAVTYDIPRGSIAGYYPEMNVVMSLHHYDRQSGTPSYKGVPVRVAAAAS